ncbi:MAG TPA: tetratricopeptide repeat protein [Candidatus Koribacter sp.]|jgi:tetratricopeptide (TPR) repeat protein
MSEEQKPNTEPAGLKNYKRLLTLLLPVLFLVIAFIGLMYRSRLFSGEKRIVLSQEESHKLEEQSKSLLEQKKYEEALQPTSTLNKAYPENHIYLGRLADIYDHLGRYADEARAWEKYMDHAPVPIEACPAIGQAYWKQGDKFEDQAVNAYRRCLAIDPKNTDSIFYLGHALEMSGNRVEAAVQYQNGLSISPGYVDLQLGLARCLVRLDKPDDAKKLADKIIAAHPDSSGAYLVLGMLYLHQEHYPEARKYLTDGLKISETDPDFHLLLARVAQETNDSAEELRQYNRLVELKPNDPQFRARRDYLARNQGK